MGIVNDVNQGDQDDGIDPDTIFELDDGFYVEDDDEGAVDGELIFLEDVVV